jgi:hypothetical protein
MLEIAHVRAPSAISPFRIQLDRPLALRQANCTLSAQREVEP